MLCTKIVSGVQNNFWSQHVLPMFCKKKSFWQRFACMKFIFKSCQIFLGIGNEVWSVNCPHFLTEFLAGFLAITVWRFSLDSPCPRVCRRDEILLLLSREVQVWTRQRIVHDLQSSLFSMRDIFTIFTVQIRIQWISRKSHLKQKVEMKFSKIFLPKSKCFFDGEEYY